MNFSQEQHEENLERWATSKYAELVAEPTENYILESKLRREGDFSDLNKYYTCHRPDYTDDWFQGAVDVRDYWDYNGIDCAANRAFLAFSRRAFSHPVVHYRGELPTNPTDGVAYKFGIGYDPIQNFDFVLDNGPTFRAMPYWAHTKHVNLHLTDFLPSDYDTAAHSYTVEMHDGFVEYYIDARLRGLVVAGGYPDRSDTSNQEGNYLLEAGPYYITVIPSGLQTSLPIKVQIENHTDSDVTWDASPNQFTAKPSSPCPGRTYRLYDWTADTLLTSGTYDSGTSHKSHPVPVAGYDAKAILFRADTDSVADGLGIEVLTQEGNWRTYLTRTYSANTLESIEPAGEFPLMRLAYEPSADGASITDAEATVR